MQNRCTEKLEDQLRFLFHGHSLPKKRSCTENHSSDRGLHTRHHRYCCLAAIALTPLSSLKGDVHHVLHETTRKLLRFCDLHHAGWHVGQM